MFDWHCRRGSESLDRVFWQSSNHRFVLYHQPRKGREQVIFPKRILYHTDEPLQDLIHTILDHKIPTTPSQIGINPGEMEIERMWSALKQDEEKIKTVGLRLTNTETGEELLWYDKDYKISHTKNTFVWSLLECRMGYAGLILQTIDANKMVNILQDKMPPETKITIWKEVSLGTSAVGIENLSNHQNHTWKFIAKLVNHYLSNHLHLHTHPPLHPH
jgi:hypothetical protein